MKRLAFLAPLLIGALGAAPLAAQQPSSAIGYSNRLARLGDIQRKAALRNAIIENGAWCRRVETATIQGRYKNLVMWVARCGPKPLIDYGLFIGPDGTVQARSCADIATLKLPPCRRLP